MHKQIIQTIKNHNMLSCNDSILIALSGGADSVALLHALISLKETLGISNIYAAHINHGLRGETAARDERFVQSLCTSLGIPLKIYHADIKNLAAAQSISIEEAGRKARYQHLAEAATHFGANKIATGHHQNDNAETIIMNLSRGAGLKGLCGIPYTNGNIIRPLLDISRAEIETYLTENSLTYITDETNTSNEYTRNRTRHTVLPTIETALNPNAAQTIAQNAALFRAEEEYLNEIAYQKYNECRVSANTLNIQKLSALHVAIARRVIRHAIAEISTLQNITANHIGQILELTQKKSGKEIHLPGLGLVVCKEYSNISIFASEEVQGFGTYPLRLDTPTFIPELNQTIIFSKTAPDITKNHKLLCTKSFDYDTITETLFLRTRRPGDKLKLGKEKLFTKKLQDYFTDKKIPKHKRDSIPIIASGNSVLWVLDDYNTTSAAHIKKEETQNICWILIERAINNV